MNEVSQQRVSDASEVTKSLVAKLDGTERGLRSSWNWPGVKSVIAIVVSRSIRRGAGMPSWPKFPNLQ